MNKKKFLINVLLVSSISVAIQSEQNQTSNTIVVTDRVEDKKNCFNGSCESNNSEQGTKINGNQENVSPQTEEQKLILNEDEKRILDDQINASLACQKELRILMRPLIEEFLIKNFEKIEKFKDNEQEITASEHAMIDELVTEFCQKNSDVISSYAIEVYQISSDPITRESFIYSFKKSFEISFKEEFINNLEIQRKVLAIVNKKK